MEENLSRLLLAFEDWLVREELLGDAFSYRRQSGRSVEKAG